jgi:hypothetical protein
MSKLSEPEVINIMREAYHDRLLEVIGESDIYDKQGNMILTKDLKVRHKDSQFEYTVDDVHGDEGTDDLVIKLNLPEEPRVGNELDDDSEEIFVIDQEEFEKEYEVK